MMTFIEQVVIQAHPSDSSAWYVTHGTKSKNVYNVAAMCGASVKDHALGSTVNLYVKHLGFATCFELAPVSF